VLLCAIKDSRLCVLVHPVFRLRPLSLWCTLKWLECHTAGNVFPWHGVICRAAVQGDSPLYFTVFAASGIPVHVINRDECDEFYRANVGSPVLGVCMQCMSLDGRARSPLSLSAFWHVSLMIAVEWTAVEKHSWSVETQLKCWNCDIGIVILSVDISLQWDNNFVIEELGAITW